MRNQDQGVTLAELYERTRIAKSTLVRLLNVLEEEGFAFRLDERPSWRIGYALYELAGDGMDASAGRDWRRML